MEKKIRTTTSVTKYFKFMTMTAWFKRDDVQNIMFDGMLIHSYN